MVRCRGVSAGHVLMYTMRMLCMVVRNVLGYNLLLEHLVPGLRPMPGRLLRRSSLCGKKAWHVPRLNIRRACSAGSGRRLIITLALFAWLGCFLNIRLALYAWLGLQLRQGHHRGRGRDRKQRCCRTVCLLRSCWPVRKSAWCPLSAHGDPPLLRSTTVRVRWACRPLPHRIRDPAPVLVVTGPSRSPGAWLRP